MRAGSTVCILLSLHGHKKVIIIHAVDCGVPLINNNVALIFNSTLEGSQLMFWCDESPSDTMIASCLSDGRWSVDLSGYSCITNGKQLIKLL